MKFLPPSAISIPVTLVLIFGLLDSAIAQRFPRATPEETGMSSSHLEQIDAIVARGIEDRKMPGCVVAVGHRGKLVYLKAFGSRRLLPNVEPMRTDTVFDLASITKPVATATSVMVLLEQGKVRLRDRVSDLIPAFGANGKKNITVTQLLTHQAGLIPDNALKDYVDGKEEAFENIYGLSTYVEPGSKFVYSDVGFIVLADLVEKMSGKNVHEFSQEHVFAPLGMTETGFTPNGELRLRAAVTEKRDGEWIQGVVHDPRAFELGGIAGHAGLFSTAEDLAVYAQMMLQKGAFDGKRILSESTVDRMTAAYAVSSGTRGLGWDKLTGYSSNRGELLTEKAFGHGGFTGTVLWVDPGLDLFYIFLSNRVHPDGDGAINHLAGRVGTVVVSAIRRPISDSTLHGVKKILPPDQHANCKTGLDVIKRNDFAPLHGKRIGLITNHTAVDSDGDWIVPTFHQSDQVELKAIFSPEHGIRGVHDIPEIADSQESGTGLKVFSLYGASRTPSPEQLEGLDCLVFDIQDIGTRFYTYISTMGLAMQAANERGLEFIVLDRPNPIGGEVVTGPMIDDDKHSFIGFHSLPIRHGMTIGELAKMFQEELSLDKLKLTVVPLEGWRRDDLLDQTGLLWINPSPNMRSLNQALLYPGVGLLETTNLSVGRGTDKPFEVVGAPWIDARQFAQDLHRLRLPGVSFIPIHFTPDSSVYENQKCGGVEVLITDRAEMQPVKTGLAIAVTLRSRFRNDWDANRYLRLLGNQRVFDAIKRADRVESILESYRPAVEAFRERRQPFLLY
ncbi:MAG: exo-beta-N-acetylmuramidase NamZ domain-containing protein [Planctomycetota bacterium]